MIIYVYGKNRITSIHEDAMKVTDTSSNHGIQAKKQTDNTFIGIKLAINCSSANDSLI